MTRPVQSILSALVLFMAVSVFAGNETAASGGSQGRLSANQFVSLAPFNIPMMPKGTEKRQFTLVVALELTDDGDRDFVRARATLIRSRTYDLLFRLIAYRTQEPLVPGTALIKKKVLEIATHVVGSDQVASIVVQQVYYGPLP
tara:strand:+ start:1475 stop:1906 length:432 start_codon:yes stop_codon:yes gene_type:complete